VADYQSDEQQLEAVKKWWQENGKAIIAGIVLGLGGLFGWQNWLAYKTRQAEAASVAYQQIMAYTETDERLKARTASRELIDQYPRSIYAALAALALASLDVAEGNNDEARAHLEWLLEEHPNRLAKQIARLRLARLALATQDFDAAWDALHGGEDLSHLSTFHELKGDILAARGERDAARSAYQQAQASRSEYDVDTEVLQFKLNDLAPRQAESDS
jgi:predicted negative regulator of RcsB-dependent stress response